MRHHTVILAGLLGLACAASHAAAQFDPRALSPLQQPAATPAPTPVAPTSAAPAPRTASPGTAQPSGTDAARRPNRATSQRATPSRRAEPAKHTPAKPASDKPASDKPASATSAPGAKPTTPPPASSNRTPARPSPPTRPDSRTVTVPRTPPAPVALPPPPVVVPARPPPPPTPVAVAPDAPGEVLPIANGTRITFGSGRSDLNPATDAAIKTLMHAAPAADTTTFTVAAYAQGTPEDPSTARRLSLARALAVRSVLITEGVASVRIYVKALGPPSAAVPLSQDGPPDRVDITVVSAAPPPPAKTP